jgi:hypothetical protein
MSSEIRQNLDELLDSVAECFTPEVARRLTQLRPKASFQSRLEELAAKANDGSLSPHENAEYAGYIEAADIIGILQAKARGLLARQSN